MLCLVQIFSQRQPPKPKSLYSTWTRERVEECMPGREKPENRFLPVTKSFKALSESQDIALVAETCS